MLQKLIIKINYVMLMRISIKFFPLNFDDYIFNKYDIQGMIYSTTFTGGITNMHDGNKFRFFTFSDVFPFNSVQKNTLYNMIISSPDVSFIDTIFGVLNKENYFYLSNIKFRIAEIKKFDLPLTKNFITGSPVVLYKDNKQNKYFSLKRQDPVTFFLRRIKENAVKKFNAFFNEDININHLIFDRLKFHKEISLLLKKRGREFNIIGTMWYNLELTRLNKKEIKFYKFIMDAGIGEKNSLGFGFLNPVRQIGQ